PAAPVRSGTPAPGFGPGGAPRAAYTPVVVPVARPMAPAPIRPSAATAVAEEAQSSPELEARWRDVLAGINGRKRMLGAFLEACPLVGWAGNLVWVAMDDLHRVVVEEQENRALIGEEIRRVFGDTHALHCVSGDGTPALARQAAQDFKPLVEQAIAWFDGEVI